MRSTRCSCSTPRAPPASRRAFSTPPAAICSERSSPRSGCSTCAMRTCSGAPRMSAGSPDTLTSLTGRSRSAPPSCCTKAGRLIPIAPLPGVTATKPGSCTQPLPGIDADIVDDHGNSVKRPDAGGYLVIRKPWPAMLRTIWRDNARYIANYWEKFNNRYYLAGDSAHRDKDGYFWIMGRIDDVLKVSGHRLGTMEIESALVAHPRVAEAAVVGKPHDIKGESVFAYVVLRGERPRGDTSALTKEQREWVGEELGPIAKPDDIRFADNLPKTRSGKIMRRLLKAIAPGGAARRDAPAARPANAEGARRPGGKRGRIGRAGKLGEADARPPAPGPGDASLFLARSIS